MIKAYTFTKTGQEWYMDLPEFIAQGGSKAELQMVEGADKMLDMMAGNENSVTLCIAKEKFEGADTLDLIEMCDRLIGGAIYLLKEFEGKQVNQRMWLCRVTEFVFGNMPQQIFLKKTNAS